MQSLLRYIKKKTQAKTFATLILLVIVHLYSLYKKKYSLGRVTMQLPRPHFFKELNNVKTCGGL